jgi:phenylpyruvate tautomerase PptA (4-oxalocrotonate tautomerase family)
MPFVSLDTNKSLSKQQSQQLMQRLSQVVAEKTDKSEAYVMVKVESDKEMQFAGKTEPLAYLECKSIGLTAEQAKNLSQALALAISDELQIPSNRIYIEFTRCDGAFWGWNGGTFG